METQTAQLDPYALPEDDCTCFHVPSPSSLRTGLSSLIERVRDVVSRVLQPIISYWTKLKEFAVGAFKGYLVTCLPDPEKNDLLKWVFTFKFFSWCFKKDTQSRPDPRL